MNGSKEFLVTAAGRVNLIGEHIDYCGGKVLPAALSLKNAVRVRPNGENCIRLSWTTLEEKVTLDFSRLEEYRSLRYGNYQAGCALLWRQAGHALVGCDMVQDCSVPFGSGLSSSAAIEVSTLAALAAVAGEQADPVELALLAQRAEREYAGVNCGIMDQYASACGKKGYAMLLDCKNVTCEYVPLELGAYTLVLLDCNKPHSLAGSKYNERRQETEDALAILKKKLPVECLADLSPADFERVKEALPPLLQRRTAHVVYECDRVTQAVEAMRAGDIARLGRLLNASHKSLSELYETTGAEPDALAAAAQRHPACAGSRLTGGGFGGCTVSLVRADSVARFCEDVCEEYRQKTGLSAKAYAAEIDDGITVRAL